MLDEVKMVGPLWTSEPSQKTPSAAKGKTETGATNQFKQLQPGGG
jgi:hypothetical protein